MATRYRDWLWVPTSFQNKTYKVLIHAQSTLCRSHSSLYKEKTAKKWRNKALLRYFTTHLTKHCTTLLSTHYTIHFITHCTALNYITLCNKSSTLEFATDNIGDRLSAIICQYSLSVITDEILPITDNNIQNFYSKIGFKKHDLL